MPTLAQSYILARKGYYIRPVIIDNTQSPNNLSDYQVLVTLDTASLISAGKMRSDCGDIRFYDSDENTMLYYWLEGPCNSYATRIWVKVPSIPASLKKTIYLYYGNPSLSSMSNAEATFLFYDDFPGTSLSGKWDVIWYDSAVSYSVSNSVLTMECDSFFWSEWYGMMIRTTSAFSTGKAIMAYVQPYVQPYYSDKYPNALRVVGFVDGSGLLDGIGGRATEASNYVKTNYHTGAYIPYPYYRGEFYSRRAGSSSSSDFSTSRNTWRRLEITWTSSRVAVFEDSGLKTSLTTNIPTGNLYVGILFARGANPGKARLYVDWIIVRNYAYPEPTTTVGAETYAVGAETYAGRYPDTI